MTDGPEDPRAKWEEVRRGGRLVFHVVVTLAATAVCVVGEVAGNLAFRKGHDLGGRAIAAAVFGVLAGNLLAVWLWARQTSK